MLPAGRADCRLLTYTCGWVGSIHRLLCTNFSISEARPRSLTVRAAHRPLRPLTVLPLAPTSTPHTLILAGRFQLLASCSQVAPSHVLTHQLLTTTRTFTPLCSYLQPPTSSSGLSSRRVRARGGSAQARASILPGDDKASVVLLVVVGGWWGGAGLERGQSGEREKRGRWLERSRASRPGPADGEDGTPGEGRRPEDGQGTRPRPATNTLC